MPASKAAKCILLAVFSGYAHIVPLKANFRYPITTLKLPGTDQAAVRFDLFWTFADTLLEVLGKEQLKNTLVVIKEQILCFCFRNNSHRKLQGKNAID